ncbi:MAG: YihY/virulence factor BrkB family protein, partial [Treponema sp.]|nr:YihY/virulence factor BrkB family protein [Treponema sp.]
MKNKIKAKITRFSQMIYLTSVFYIQNNLDSCASACTFGFIFSFIPIIMMILTIFIGILRASPEIVEAISHEINNLTNVFDVNKFVENIYEGISFSWVNILLAIFIIWMARKLFVTIIKGLYSIFNTEVPPRPFINQLLTIASEICIVIISSVVFFAAFTTRQLFSLPVFEKISFLSPVLFSSLSNVITNITLYFVLFIFSVFAYKIGTGSKPPLRVCFLCSALCIGIFYICIIVI